MEKYYTFALDEHVNRTSVSYPNRYGIRIAADLYTAKDMDETSKYPALVIGPPYGGVKEQGPRRLCKPAGTARICLSGF